MAKKSIRDAAVRGQRVLIRADLNVPLESGVIGDDRRIRMFLPTLQHVLAQGGRAIVMSHLGRPVGDPIRDAEFSLRPVAVRMQELLQAPVRFVSDCTGPTAMVAANDLKDGETVLLENLRFYPAETIIDQAKKNPDKRLTTDQQTLLDTFSAALAKLGDWYVNDAFGTCHRRHASMYSVPQRLPAGRRVMGFLVEKELQFLGAALQQNPRRPFLAILGGAKVRDKIGVIQNLLARVDQILIGGAMMFTFWAAQGRAVGRSRHEADQIDLARQLLEQAGDKLFLPTDCVTAAELKAGVATQVAVGAVPDDQMGLDIGPATVAAMSERVGSAATIFWNGPLGAFETPPFDAGTLALARCVAEATQRGAVTVIGGGDSAAAFEQAGLADAVSHISTGGGASLEFLEGKRFDPIEVLDEA